MALLALPMYVLYEASIWIILLLEKSWKSYRAKHRMRPNVDESMVLRRLRTYVRNVLFAVLAVCGVGVINVDRRRCRSRKGRERIPLDSYPAPIARAILRLGFDNIYHSPWYVGHYRPYFTFRLHGCTFKRVIPARLPTATSGENR